VCRAAGPCWQVRAGRRALWSPADPTNDGERWRNSPPFCGALQAYSLAASFRAIASSHRVCSRSRTRRVATRARRHGLRTLLSSWPSTLCAHLPPFDTRACRCSGAAQSQRAQWAAFSWRRLAPQPNQDPLLEKARHRSSFACGPALRSANAKMPTRSHRSLESRKISESRRSASAPSTQ
jgi:hypothetical protein